MKIHHIAALIFMCITTISQAQTASSIATKPFGKAILENDKVKVYEYESSSGKDICGLGKHSHPAHLTVMLTDANVTVTSADGKVMSQKVKAGTTFWSEAETHTVINSGTSIVKCEIIEYKDPKHKP